MKNICSQRLCFQRHRQGRLRQHLGLPQGLSPDRGSSPQTDDQGDSRPHMGRLDRRPPTPPEDVQSGWLTDEVPRAGSPRPGPSTGLCGPTGRPPTPPAGPPEARGTAPGTSPATSPKMTQARNPPTGTRVCPHRQHITGVLATAWIHIPAPIRKSPPGRRPGVARWHQRLPHWAPDTRNQTERELACFTSQG